MEQSARNREQENEKLRKSAQLVHDFYAELNDNKDPKKNNLPITLFRATADLTLERVETGVALEDIRFNPKELRAKVLDIGFLKKSKDEDSEWVRKNWHNLEDELEQRKSHLLEFSKKKVEEFYPWIEKEESKGSAGKNSYYYLIAKSFNEQEKTETLMYPCPEGGLHYVQESLTNIPRWARWINGFTLKRWRKYAYLLPGLVLLLVTLVTIGLVLLLGLYTSISTVKWLTLLFVSLWLGWLVISSSLYRVTWNRIVMAPDWMTPLKESSVQLELKKIGTDPETGNAIRSLRLVVYSAKCPICKGRVEVQGGGMLAPIENCPSVPIEN
jgi:hypothetical protein